MTTVNLEPGYKLKLGVIYYFILQVEAEGRAKS